MNGWEEATFLRTLIAIVISHDIPGHGLQVILHLPLLDVVPQLARYILEFFHFELLLRDFVLLCLFPLLRIILLCLQQLLFVFLHVIYFCRALFLRV